MTDPLTRLNSALEGRYRIEREIGEGGMATVYLAEDLRHERKVALKVLKPELAAVVGAERFLAEIKTTANLQHPHILALYDSGEADGFLFFVTPFIEGDTLRDKIDREKQLSVEDALKITADVASALDYAHEHGVVHRDIKPGNILLSEKGEPTVADFGIALAVAQAGGGRVTETGLSVGTPHYMSPEQATGDRDVDPRTDVYALGCVLYEMLTGDPPYQGSTAQAVLAQILTADPISPTAKRVSIPPNVDAAIRKALEKLPADRFGSAQDLAGALADPSFRHGDEAEVAVEGMGLWNWLSMGSTGVAAGLALALGWALLRPEPPEPVTRNTLTPPSGVTIDQPRFRGFAAAPDGRTVVFADALSGQLYYRDLAQLDAVAIPGAENAWIPFFSPEGEWVGFVDEEDRALKRARLDGSRVETITPVTETVWGADWSPDGTIVFSTFGGGLWRVLEAGGEAQQIPGTSGYFSWWLDLLPENRAILATDVSGPEPQVFVVSLETGERTVLFPGSTARYLPSGHVIFWRDDDLWVVPFDLARLTPTGQPRPVVEGVAAASGNGLVHFAVGGGLLFYRGGAGRLGGTVLVWVDRSGNEQLIDPSEPIQNFATLALSPDDRHLAVGIFDGDTDIWVKELPDGPLTRLTTDPAFDRKPVWSADGVTIAYLRGQGDSIHARTVRSDGSSTGGFEILLQRERTVGEVLFTPDQRGLIFRQGRPTQGDADLGYVELETGEVDETLLASEFNERAIALSPDGRWLAYVSDVTGENEVFVRPFPSVGSARVPISTDGGIEPVWANSGRELFYREPRTGAMVAIGFNAESGFEVQERVILFDASPYSVVENGNYHSYDVTSDDQRFVMTRQEETNEGQTGRLILVQNFFEELRQLVPE